MPGFIPGVFPQSLGYRGAGCRYPPACSEVMVYAEMLEQLLEMLTDLLELVLLCFAYVSRDRCGWLYG